MFAESVDATQRRAPGAVSGRQGCYPRDAEGTGERLHVGPAVARFLTTASRGLM